MSGLSPSFACSRPLALTGLTGLMLLSADARAGVPVPTPVSGSIVLQNGDTPTGGPAVVDMASPFVNDGGEVGFVGLYDDGDHFVWVGNAVVWNGSDDVMNALTGLEPRMDSNAAGNFVYAIDVNGADGLYTDAGPFAVTGDPIPGLMGTNYTFLGNPAMTADGTIYFVAGFDDTGDGFTDGRMLARTPDGTAASVVSVLMAGDVVDMLTIDDNDTGIDFSYAVSEDNLHLIQVANVEGDTASDAILLVDGMIVARELDPTGDGDNWDNFDLVAINVNGNYMFTGDTDAFAGDEFIAYNGTVALREGDNVGGIDLTGGSELRFIALTDSDQATHAWAYNGPAGFRETVFFACDAADIPGSSFPVFTTIDNSLDVDGDGMGDYAITNVTMSGPTESIAMGPTDFIYAHVELDDGMSTTAAMIEVPVTCCGNGNLDPFEDCDDGNLEDTDDCTSACVAATCGDGFVLDGVEECDDGNDVDTDDCPTTCVAATCGDGFVLDGREECDDGNDVDGDGCDSDCTMSAVSDSSGGNDTGSADSTGGGSQSGSDGSGGDTSAGPGPSTVTFGGGDSTGGGTDTDTDTDGNGEFIEDDGCGCHSGNERGSALVFGLGLLGLLGRRRRRRLVG